MPSLSPRQIVNRITGPAVLRILERIGRREVVKVPGQIIAQKLIEHIVGREVQPVRKTLVQFKLKRMIARVVDRSGGVDDISILWEWPTQLRIARGELGWQN